MIRCVPEERLLCARGDVLSRAHRCRHHRLGPLFLRTGLAHGLSLRLPPLVSPRLALLLPQALGKDVNHAQCVSHLVPYPHALQILTLQDAGW